MLIFFVNVISSDFAIISTVEALLFKFKKKFQEASEKLTKGIASEQYILTNSIGLPVLSLQTPFNSTSCPKTKATKKIKKKNKNIFIPKKTKEINLY